MSADHNPYTPPAAEVAVPEPLAPGKRPIAVTIAVVLIAVQVGIGILAYLRSWRVLTGMGGMDLAVFGMQMTRYLWLALTTYLLWRGRNSGRILLLIVLMFSVLSLLTTLWTLSRLPVSVNYRSQPMTFVPMLLPLAMYLVAAILVYLPGRAWFMRAAR